MKIRIIILMAITLFANLNAKAQSSDDDYLQMGKIWKNGVVEHVIDDGRTHTSANSVYVSDGEAYAALWVFEVAKLWKNGDIQALSAMPGFAEASSVYVSGNDVYVAGYHDGVAMLWKNGVAQKLTDGTRLASALSVYAADGDVYVAGFERNKKGKDVAKLWKNGVVHNLTDGANESTAFAVVVSDGDVYVGGYENNSQGNGVATIWKNGTPQRVTDGSSDEWINAVFVSGNDVYATGSKTWKNGALLYANKGRSIYVADGDVYVAGYEKNSQSNGIAKLWKNGVAQNLTDGKNDAVAFSVFVSDGDVYVAGYEWTNYYEIERDDYDDYDDYYDDDEGYFYFSLMEAIEKGDVATISEFIKSGEANDFDGRVMVLSMALEMEKYDMFEHFLRRQPHLINSAIDWNGNTFLHEAAINGALKTVQYLVGKGVNVNAANEDGYTPIILALENDNPGVVAFLRSKGANPNIMVRDFPPNESNMTPVLFKYYYQNRHVDKEYRFLKTLIGAGVDVDARDDYQKTLLFYATGDYGADLKLAEFLIKNGADVNARNSEGETPLFGAISMYDAGFAKLLIDNGADINVVDNYETTPLFEALSYSNYEVVKYLLEKGADVNQKNINGDTPLHEAVKDGNLELVMFMVEKGADVHATNNKGHSPIYYTDSSSKIDKSIIKYLISKGANKKEAGRYSRLFDIDFSF